jgi:hypothetical protein
MAGNIKLEVVTPDKAVVSEDVQIVMAPGSLGEFGVLIGHTPFLTTLKTGIIRYTDAQGTERYVFVSGGDLPKRCRIKLRYWPNQPREAAKLILNGPKQPWSAPRSDWPQTAPGKISILIGQAPRWNGLRFASDLRG